LLSGAPRCTFATGLPSLACMGDFVSPAPLIVMIEMPLQLRLFTCFIVLAALAFSPEAPRAQTFASSAPWAILVDAESESVLYEKNADELMSPASLVKIMTAELVFKELREGRFNLDDTFTISENAWRRGGAPSGGSAMFAQLNSRVRIEDLTRGRKQPHAIWPSCRSMSSRPIRNITGTSARLNSPGTRSASLIAIRCWP
jgi:hypothetical protein